MCSLLSILILIDLHIQLFDRFPWRGSSHCEIDWKYTEIWIVDVKHIIISIHKNNAWYRHTACECLYWYKYISSTCLSNASHPWHGSSIFLGNKPRLSSLLRGVGICAKFHPQVSYMFTLTFGAGAAAPSFNGKCRGFFLYKRILSLLFLYMMMYKVTAWKTGMLKSQNLFQKPGDTISDFFCPYEDVLIFLTCSIISKWQVPIHELLRY